MNEKMGEEDCREVEDQSLLDSGSEKSSVTEAIEVTSSLIFLSHSIKAFNVKWNLIRNKLEELNSRLISIQNCDSSGEPSLSTLLPDVFVSLNECNDHAKRCVDLSYSGKLLMQSDLDVMLAKFDRHLKNLNRIYTAGILTHGFAIIVSKPGFGACKDDMRFYIRDLQTRMKIGDKEMKKHALVNLYQVMEEDEKYVKLAVEIGELINILVSFLDSTGVEIQQEAAKILYVISGVNFYKNVLIGAGIIGPLVRVLEHGSELGREASTRCLMKLTAEADNAWSISAHGGVTALLKICSTGESNGELIGSACGVLRNLVGVEEIKRFIVEEGGVPTFIKLLRSKDEIVQVNSIEFLQNIAYGDESIQQMVIQGAIPTLVRILDPKLSFSSKTKEITLRAIENLCFTSINTINILMSYGFLTHILFLLRNGHVSVQQLALKASFRLCGTSEDAKKSMGDAGFMPELVKLLDAKSFEVREMAIETLYSMILVSKNRKRFAHDETNIGYLLQLLDRKEGNSGNIKLLISILMSLTSCNSARKKITSSGYLKTIEKLAETEISDAKKLVKKLTTNRFRIMLNGIWHS